MTTIAVAARLTLAALLIIAGISKLRGYRTFVPLLTELGLQPAIGIAIAVPMAEICIAIWLLTGLAAALAGLVAGALLVLFTGVVLRAILSGRSNLKCNCFGPIGRSKMSWRVVVRNAILTGLAAMVVAIPGSSFTHSPVDQIVTSVGLAALAVATVILLDSVEMNLFIPDSPRRNP